MGQVYRHNTNQANPNKSSPRVVIVPSYCYTQRTTYWHTRPHRAHSRPPTEGNFMRFTHTLRVPFLILGLTACGTASFADGTPSTTTSSTTTTVPEPEYVKADTLVRAEMPSTTVEVVPPPTVPQQNWQCPDAVEMAVLVGWPVEELPTLDRVVFRESTCNPGSHNPSDPATGSYGLMQVNGFWCTTNKYNPDPAGWLGARGVLDECSDMFDPRVGLYAGLLIWQRSGWSPWSTA